MYATLMQAVSVKVLQELKRVEDLLGPGRRLPSGAGRARSQASRSLCLAQPELCQQGACVRGLTQCVRAKPHTSDTDCMSLHWAPMTPDPP